jgi:hypothetical protein
MFFWANKIYSKSFRPKGIFVKSIPALKVHEQHGLELSLGTLQLLVADVPRKNGQLVDDDA